MAEDWIWGLVGGLMIGCAGAIYLLGNGRIMGASGILGGIVDGSAGTTRSERAFFLLGVIALPAGLHLFGMPAVTTHLTGNLALVAMAGLLVGIGTRIGNGCTSGHGVCGISRFSLRGIISTLTYIAAGVATVAAMRGLGGLG